MNILLQFATALPLLLCCCGVIIADAAAAGSPPAHLTVHHGPDVTNAASKTYRFDSLQDAFQALQLLPPRLHKTLDVGPGLHRINATLKLNASASNTIVRGQGANASGVTTALEVTNFVAGRLANGMEVWNASLPSGSLTPYFWQLFVTLNASTGTGGTLPTFERRVSARSQVMAYDHASEADPEHAIVYKPGQVLDLYRNQDRVLATLYHCWTATTHLIHTIYPHNNTLVLYQAPHVNIPRCEHASGKRFFISNAIELLDEAGEYYYDESTGVLSYIPMPEEQLASFRAFVPQVVEAIRGDGVSNLTFEHLSFLHGQADMDGFFKGDCDAQSATNLQTAFVHFNRSSNVLLSHLVMAHIGTFAVWPNRGCRNVTVDHVHMYDLGVGGFRAGTASNPSSEDDLTLNAKLSNSVLEDGGHVYIHGPGVVMQYAANCSITHNIVQNFFYSAISIGWWPPDKDRNLVVAYNDLNTIGKGQLSDMGCVYSLGSQPGTLVNNNLCYNVTCYNYGAWGLYTDEHSQGLTLTNNIVYDTQYAAVHEHYGTDIVISNNVLVRTTPYATGGGEGVLQIADPSKTEGLSFHMSQNIVVSQTDAPLFAQDQADFKNSSLDYNTYFAGNQSFPSRQTLEQWQQRDHQDMHSIFQDPQFVDPRSNHFSKLSPSSPAFKLGFQAIDISNVGPQQEK